MDRSNVQSSNAANFTMIRDALFPNFPKIDPFTNNEAPPFDFLNYEPKKQFEFPKDFPQFEQPKHFEFAKDFSQFEQPKYHDFPKYEPPRYMDNYPSSSQPKSDIGRNSFMFLLLCFVYMVIKVCMCLKRSDDDSPDTPRVPSAAESHHIIIDTPDLFPRPRQEPPSAPLESVIVDLPPAYTDLPPVELSTQNTRIGEEKPPSYNEYLRDFS